MVFCSFLRRLVYNGLVEYVSFCQCVTLLPNLPVGWWARENQRKKAYSDHLIQRCYWINFFFFWVLNAIGSVLTSAVQNFKLRFKRPIICANQWVWFFLAYLLPKTILCFVILNRVNFQYFYFLL